MNPRYIPEVGDTLDGLYIWGVRLRRYYSGVDHRRQPEWTLTLGRARPGTALYEQAMRNAWASQQVEVLAEDLVKAALQGKFKKARANTLLSARDPSVRKKIAASLRARGFKPSKENIARVEKEMARQAKEPAKKRPSAKGKDRIKLRKGETLAGFMKDVVARSKKSKVKLKLLKPGQAKLPPPAKVRRPDGKPQKVWVYPSRAGLWAVSAAYGKKRVTEKFRSKTAALGNARRYRTRIIMGSEFSHLPEKTKAAIRTQAAILIHFDKMHPAQAFAAASSMHLRGTLPSRFPKAKVSAIQKAKAKARAKKGKKRG